MDLRTNPASQAVAGSSNIVGHGTGEIPEAAGEAIFRRAEGERVLWRGRPEVRRFAATAFHTNSVVGYFAILAVIAFATDGLGSAITVAVMGLGAFLILWGLAYLYTKKSTYILTSHRVVLVSGIAFEKRISIPLKHIGAANLKHRGPDHGSIALEIAGERQLGYLLLWPHARPLRFLRAQPMLRVIPEVDKVARMLAEARAEFSAIESNLTEINEVEAAIDRQENGPAADRADPDALIDKGLTGAPA